MRKQRTTRRRGQQGYAMLVVLLLFSVFVITLATAVPRWKTAIQRDRETTEIDYAHQYVEGVKRYYHKFGSYPPSIERLKATNGIHYLRQAWPDPLTGKPFKLLQFTDLKNGEVVGGGMGIPAAGGAPGKPMGSTASSGSSGGLGSLFGGAGGSDAGGSPGAGLFSGTVDNSDSDSNDSSQTPAAGTETAPASASTPGATAMAPGTTAASNSASFTRNGPTSGAGAGMTGGLFGGTQQPGAGHVFGGAGIVGVASTSKKPAVHAFNRKHRPDQWQFVYNPMQDRSMLGPGVGNGPALGQPLGSGTNSGTMTGPATTGTSSGTTTDGTGVSNPGGGLFNNPGPR